jgi:hypothetical protein
VYVPSAADLKVLWPAHLPDQAHWDLLEISIPYLRHSNLLSSFLLGSPPSKTHARPSLPASTHRETYHTHKLKMPRHPPPTYEQNQASDMPVYDEEEEAPGYDERRYTSSDPYAQENTDMPENSENLDRDVDPHAQDNDDHDDDENEDDPMEEASDPEGFRRELAERESGFEREELDDTYNVEEQEEEDEDSSDDE